MSHIFTYYRLFHMAVEQPQSFRYKIQLTVNKNEFFVVIKEMASIYMVTNQTIMF